ncbi:hypothetical protein FRC03_002759 [Tulasnella sp. 419]|nr:hypothetical protein FRC03_002759 [Tulasnella sp. 419]
MVLFLPETSVSLKARQAAALSSPPIPAPSTTSVRSRSTSTLVKAGILFTLKQTLKHTIQPLAAILYLLFPPIGLTALYSSICFASLYGISTTTPFSFSEPPYKFDSLTISLLYLPSCVGYMLGSVCGGYLSDRELRHAKARYGDNYPPEARLRSARWGVPLIPAGLLMFGWGVSRWDHVAVPLIGGFIFGVGLMLTNGTIMAFFADVIPGQTASVVAAFNLMRNLLAGLVAAVTIPAIKSGLQEGWFLTILAVLCTISSLSLETVQRLGPYWRQRREERVQNARSEAAAERSMRGSIRPATSVSSPSRAHSVRSVTSERPIPLYTLPSSPISPDPQGSSLSQVPIKDDTHNVKS